MNQFQRNAAIVIAFLKENHYSESTIHRYEQIYDNVNKYLKLKGVVYSPDIGEEMLAARDDSFFGIKRDLARIACIRKINAIYKYGAIQGVQFSPHRAYSRIPLTYEFDQTVRDFMEYCKDIFSPVQQENVSRRIKLFFRFLQSNSISQLNEISYETIVTYHCHLTHLNQKPVSRMIEESTVHQMLHFLAERGRIPYGIYLCLLLISKDELVAAEGLPLEERKMLEDCRHMVPKLTSSAFREAGEKLIQDHLDAGYAPKGCFTAKRTLMHFYLFLDMNGLGYLPEIAEIWLNCDVVKRSFQGSSWKAARRFLNVFHDMVLNGQPDFNKVYRKGITGLQELPDWCRIPLMDYTALRVKEKLEVTTVNNDIYSILRLIRFLLQEGVRSYAELTGEMLTRFNLYDKHGSPEGKNSCNARIRRFLKYLGREGYLKSNRLYMSLSTTAATVETIVAVFTDEEIQMIRDYVASASTPLEIRDSAIILMGCDMGIRGCDIVKLRIRDIDWKAHCIHFRQDKTDTDITVVMPTAVGNAVFRYLKEVRNRNTGNDKVFLSLKAPYRSLTRSVCYETLHRILPKRSVRGSGFHVTRKTFSTNRLRNGIEPGMIADAIGHAGANTLTPYLALDDGRMLRCPLSLSELSIPMKGGF